MMTKFVPFISFLLLGFVVGHLGGLSDSPVVTMIITALFALIGGSLITFFREVTTENNIAVMVALAGICVGILLGVHAGIFLKFNAYALERSETSRCSLTTLLRGSEINKITSIDQQVRSGELPIDKGYDQIIDLLGVRK